MFRAMAVLTQGKVRTGNLGTFPGAGACASLWADLVSGPTQGWTSSAPPPGSSHSAVKTPWSLGLGSSPTLYMSSSLLSTARRRGMCHGHSSYGNGSTGFCSVWIHSSSHHRSGAASTLLQNLPSSPPLFWLLTRGRKQPIKHCEKVVTSYLSHKFINPAYFCNSSS